MTVDDAPVCERSVASGSLRRIDCAVTVGWNPAIPHDVVVRGPTNWTLESLELATYHGHTNGAHDMLLLGIC